VLVHESTHDFNKKKISNLKNSEAKIEQLRNTLKEFNLSLNTNIDEEIVKLQDLYTEKNKEKVLKYESWGLLLFVAIPLPGTGGWTGALMAGLLDMRFKRSLPIIALGVLIAGFIMSGLTYGIFQM
jgi:uncharacterized membrane protein